jgi:hypothetical protein
VAWLYRGKSKGNWWYLESRIAGHRIHRALKTQDRAVAEAELAKQLALEKSIPRPDGRIRWRPEEYEQFKGMPGQSRVARQQYACAARAMIVLTDTDRWAWLFKPTPKTCALAALGRLLLEPMMKLAADEACERKMTYRQAVAFVRRLLGRHAKARTRTLHNAVRSAVKVFRDMHPETTGEETARTLRELATEFEAGRNTPCQDTGHAIKARHIES